jgi:hypothetical protein
LFASTRAGSDPPSRSGVTYLVTFTCSSTPDWLLADPVRSARSGGAVALVQLRRQGEVLKGEVERNQRRDELLDGQLAELRDRSEDRTRQQAELIQAEFHPSFIRDVPATGSVWNRSGRPVTSVAARVMTEEGNDVAARPDEWRALSGSVTIARQPRSGPPKAL